LRGYAFKVNGGMYGCYHFKRQLRVEIHFYNASKGTSDVVNRNNSAPLVVYTTVFKILLDYLEKKAGSDILIAFDEERKNMYLKFIKLAFKRYDVISKNYLSDEFPILKTEEGEPAFLIKSKMKGLRECIVDLSYLL